MKHEQEMVVGGRRLRLSNLNKVLYPEAGFTKGDVIDYYIRIAHAMLPHLKNRPMTLKRYPDGVEDEAFFEKNCPAFHPAWMRTAPIWSERKGEPTNFCLINDLPSLVWTANLAAIELHPSLSRAKELDRPTAVAFDLDPGAPAGVLDCCRIALALRSLFSTLNLASFPKTSGSKGLQVYIPLNTPVTYDETKAFARAVALLLETRCPGQVLSNMKKSLRSGKVFVDWSQNDVHKTTVCAYSLRARERPTVSTPLRWEEVERAVETKKAQSLRFESKDVLERVKRFGDLFRPVLTQKQKLPALH